MKFLTRQGNLSLPANFSWTFFDKVLRSFSNLVVGIFLARYLGPSLLGSLSYAITLSSLFITAATLGLDSIVIKYILKFHKKAYIILSTSFISRLVGGGVALILSLALFSFFKFEEGELAIVLILSSLLIFQAFEVLEIWFQSQENFSTPSIIRTASNLAVSVLKLLAIHFSAGLIWFAWIIVLESALVTVGLYIAFKKHVTAKVSFFEFDRKPAFLLLRKSWPLIFSNLAIMIYMRIDQVMLKDMVSASELGLYSIAVRLCEAWYIIPMTIYAVTLPSILKAKHESSPADFHLKMQKLYALVVFISYSIIFPMFYFSDSIVYFLYGKKFQAAAPMFSILIWSLIFTGIGVVRSSFITANNLQKFHFLSTFIGCITNIVLNFLLIPRWGGMGAAISSVVSYAVSGFLTCFFFKDLRANAKMICKAMVYPKFW